MNNSLSVAQQNELIQILKSRFEKNMHRHKGIEWSKVLMKLESNGEKIWALNEMEKTGGEPDVINFDTKTNVFTFCDCSSESPKGRRSICYDREALNSRKKHKPENNAVDLANDIGIELLSEDHYRKLQEIGDFDTKTSSWLKTPIEVRKQGGAIFGDFRYGRVFIYHNSAESYYGARGFRGLLRV